MTRKTVFYQQAATRIASQKIVLAKIVAAYRHSRDLRVRARNAEIAKLRKVLKSSVGHLARLAVAKDKNWMRIKDELDGELNRFDDLAENTLLDSGPRGNQRKAPRALSFSSKAREASSTRSRTRSKPAAPP